MRSPLARILAFAGVALAVASCQAPPSVTGRVSPRARVELPHDAVLEVQVADVSRPDAAPVVIVRRDYTRLGSSPWPFTLSGSGVRALDPTHVYAVQARILVDGRPALVNKRRTVVDPTRLSDTLDVIVDPVARTVGVLPDGAASPRAGLWNPPGAPATLPAPMLPPPDRSARGPATASADARLSP